MSRQGVFLCFQSQHTRGLCCQVTAHSETETWKGDKTPTASSVYSASVIHQTLLEMFPVTTEESRKKS